MNVLSPRASAGAAVTIGVVGTHELVERIMTVAQQQGGDWRLVGAAYIAEHEARARLRTIESKIDVCLFAGPFAYDLARADGDLPVPATYVPVSGAALYSTLLRGLLDETCDPARISVDSVPRPELTEAYNELGISTDQVHVQTYERPESATTFRAFHEQLYRQGETTAALTTVPSVEHELAAAGVPVLRILPVGATLRVALNTAALLGSTNRLEEAQLAIASVQPAAAARPVHAGPGNYWQQELNLALHRQLLQEARRTGAIVVPRDEHGFLLITTLGAIERATNGFQVAPFLDRVQSELGFPVEVGIGFGRTARDAEAKAQTAVEKSAGEKRTETNTGSAVLVCSDDAILTLPATPTSGDYDQAGIAGASKGAEILDRLLARIGSDDELAVVDADKVASALGVTARTARRLLHTLVDEGLAWPLPPARSARAGRPRQPYQLIAQRAGNLTTNETTG